MTEHKLDNESDLALPQDTAAPDAEHASVLVAVRAVLAAAGRDVDAIDLAGASGLGLLVAFPTADGVCVGDGVILGRDLPLRDSIDAFGLVTRPLHPPELDGGASCGQFEKHFHDSYAPLMAGYLQHGQPLLCWGGWPGDAADAWGVLTRCDESAGRFAGWPAGGADEPVPLANPPRQVHAVEQVLDAPTPETMLATGLRLAADWKDNAILSAGGVLTGSAALDAWAERLRGDDFCAACEADGWRCHVRLAESMYHARIAAYEFIHRHAEAADASGAETLQRLELALGDQVDLLADAKDANRVHAAFAGDRTGLADTVARLADAQREIERALTS